VLTLHDEALAADDGGAIFAGPVRVGMVQDFAETAAVGAPRALFAELHADSQIFARVAGTAELLTLLDARPAGPA
jgi:hypothetical protein